MYVIYINYVKHWKYKIIYIYIGVIFVKPLLWLKLSV